MKMREIMRLVESSLSYDDDGDFDDEFEDDDSPEVETTGYRFGRLREFYLRVKQVAEDHMGCGSDIAYDDVQTWVEHHRELFRPGRIKVYRIMALNPSFVEQLQPGAELGQHWSYEFDEAAVDGFDIHGAYEHAAKGVARLYVFEAEIETNDVAFPLTVAYNCLFDHEKEIFLPMHAKPKLTGLVEYDATRGVQDRQVRPDLIGQVFSV
jgi:hypothetical protein